MIDLGTGNNNKINWTMEDKQEMIDIIETVYRGARKGRGLVVSPKDYSTKYRYWFLFFLFWYFVDIKEGLFLKKKTFLLTTKQDNILPHSCMYYFVPFVVTISRLLCYWIAFILSWKPVLMKLDTVKESSYLNLLINVDKCPHSALYLIVCDLIHSNTSKLPCYC